MRALEPEVVDVIWAAVEPLLAVRPVGGPGRGHRPRIPDRLCFWGILVRLATGCSWQCAEALLGWQVSDTTLRSRRDEWVAAGVFELIAAEAIAAYDRIVGLDLDDVCVDGSTHKAPCGGEGTGKSPVDRCKSGWKWSIAIDGAGIPVGWAAAGANRNDIMLFDPTIAEIERQGLHHDTETLHLDRGYWGARVDRSAAAAGITDLVRPPKRKPGHDGPAEPMGAGNSAVVVDLPRWGPMLSPRVPNLVPIPGPRMERVTPGQRPRPNYGHPQARESQHIVPGQHSRPNIGHPHARPRPGRNEQSHDAA